jgi:ribose transport system permease protein
MRNFLSRRIEMSLQAKFLSRVRVWRESGALSVLAPVGALAVLVLAMSIGSQRFLTLQNFINMLEQSSTLLIMGLGETFIILMGAIDLSIAPVAALATIITAMLIPKVGYLAFLIAILFGCGAGALTGLVHTKTRLPSFVATLGAMGLWTGVGFTISNATPIQIARKDGHYLTWITGSIFGLPNEILIAMGVLLICFILEDYTRFGRYVRAIGAGERVTRLSGVLIDRYKTLAFTLCGTLAALCGVLLAARMSGGSARMADGFLLRAIAIVILGGTAISGGIGGVLRTFIGALIVMVLDTGMNMVGINNWFQQAVYGATVILAVALTIDRSKIPIIK